MISSFHAKKPIYLSVNVLYIVYFVMTSGIHITKSFFHPTARRAYCFLMGFVCANGRSIIERIDAKERNPVSRYGKRWHDYLNPVTYCVRISFDFVITENRNKTCTKGQAIKVNLTHYIRVI